MSDRRELQPGDRAAIYEADVSGTVRSSNLAVTVLDGDDHVTYTVPTMLVSWIPPDDDPVFEIGAAYRDADEPGGERYWFLPDSTTDTPFIAVVATANKLYRRYFRRDQLPRQIEEVI